jgi:hypothetical protein
MVAWALAGCAYNVDRSGISRVGVFLWGFGDPPGVNWNLDWPRREPPDLPPTTHPELPPVKPPWSRLEFRDAPVDGFRAPAQPAAAIDDNRDCGIDPHPTLRTCRADPRSGARRGVDDRG